MKYTTLGFTMFRKCNAQCEICYFESSPSCKESLDIHHIKRFIDSAVGDPDLQTISFTGGEPFLEYDLLEELVKYVSEKGFRAAVVTNCFWANSENIAMKKLGKLKKAGLSKVSISYDEFHAKFIDASHVRNVLTACKCLNIPILIGIMKKRDSDIGNTINSLSDAVLNCGTMIYPVLPIGGASKTLSSSDYIKLPIDNLNLSCQYDGNIVVRYDGKIHPCCNQCVVETALVVGDYAEDTYEDAIRRIKNNGLLFLLRTVGLSPFFKYAKETIGLNVPSEIVSPCELCSLFFSDENIDKFYPFVKECMERNGVAQKAVSKD